MCGEGPKGLRTERNAKATVGGDYYGLTIHHNFTYVFLKVIDPKKSKMNGPGSIRFPLSLPEIKG
jgi:hypothetical protein